ncbi:MAG: MgtC/SapB family protein [Bacilli bacterium]
MSNYTEFLFQIVVCFLLSSCIGIERQYRRRSVGLRTIILVSLGAFLFVRYSFSFPDSDMNRIAAQVVAGIGFLGAGVIIKDGKTVKGLTTAATLWCAAAIGVLCSANLLFEAAIGTLFILFTNIILRSVNSKINNLSGNINYNLYSFSIICEEKNENQILKIIKEITKENKASINHIETSDTENGNIKLDICILINSNNDALTSEIMQRLPGRKDVISISLNKKDKRFLYEEEEL